MIKTNVEIKAFFLYAKFEVSNYLAMMQLRFSLWWRLMQFESFPSFVHEIVAHDVGRKSEANSESAWICCQTSNCVHFIWQKFHGTAPLTLMGLTSSIAVPPISNRFSTTYGMDNSYWIKMSILKVNHFSKDIFLFLVLSIICTYG